MFSSHNTSIAVTSHPVSEPDGWMQSWQCRDGHILCQGPQSHTAICKC